MSYPVRAEGLVNMDKCGKSVVMKGILLLFEQFTVKLKKSIEIETEFTRQKWTMKETFIFFKIYVCYKSIQTDAVFTREKWTRNEVFICFQIVTSSTRHNYSSEFSDGRGSSKSTFLIWGGVNLRRCFSFNIVRLQKEKSRALCGEYRGYCTCRILYFAKNF